MIVVDTCVLIWLSNDPAMLSKAAIESIDEARRHDGIAISCVTLYEVAWLSERKRITIQPSLSAFLADSETNLSVLPVTASVAQFATKLPASYPSDPMDRIIGATALDRGVPLITPDRAIHKSKAVPVVW